MLVLLPMYQIQRAKVSTQIPVSVSIYGEIAYPVLTAVKSARKLQINRHFKKESNSENIILKKKMYQVKLEKILASVCFRHFYFHLCFCFFGAATQRGSWPPHS
jgi:hypothetical protein